MLHKFNVYMDDAQFDPDQNVTSIRGWGLNLPDSSALTVVEDGLPVIHYTPKNRWDINMRYGITNETPYGFELALKGDWTNKLDRIKLRSVNDKEDTEYVVNLTAPQPGSRPLKQEIKNMLKKQPLLRRLVKKENPEQKTPYELYLEEAEADLKDLNPSKIEGPLISIVVPVYNIGEKFLRLFLDSVENQTYPNWQLCIADDCSTEPHVKRVLEEYQKKDSRIDVVYRKENGHISRATNSAIALAKGEFIAFMDNDDELAPNALEEVVKVIKADPEVDFIYTDEDKVDEEGVRFDPFFKPEWNETLLYGHNYITHFVVVRRSVGEKAGWLNPEYNGSQDYDFVLRATREARKVAHIPKMLYHWRAVKGSVADRPEAKPYAYIAGKNALQHYFDQNGIDAKVEIGKEWGSYDVDYLRSRDPKVAVMLALPFGQDAELAKITVQEILAETDYPNYEILLMNVPECTGDPRVKYYYDSAYRNEGFLRNYLTKKTDADYYLFVSDVIRPAKKNWMSELVNQIQRKDIGICGPKLINEAYITRSGGATIAGGNRHEVMQGFYALELGYYYRMFLPQQVFAVNYNCLLVKAEPFKEVGGFDDQLLIYEQDIDLSMKMRAIGFETVFVPQSLVIYDSEVNDDGKALPNIVKRYGDQAADAYINPNIQLGGKASTLIRY